ncbi:glutamyl-tRNA reductase [Helicobacter saguini]|uniref:Glutamyl-tRNA reductase n=1 Tax=Helicobacter saguini TaxID=1548018 RepID=A0A347VV36_9HELI|nr:glutamyl-tRNA reductase [Helicobacter saguini]MWV62589.1 glutamyl-tRNA reductase [Helicobacter saguini]MWV66737.1 glutamyl-tRNA reductase [Helicobacter saguini]MWV69088.1 glutamyl-tRNA reductase [Helicobacter saguini]MWV71358.1 glutamyl-tRNA reductase [Helicobacter saguini]TLD93994.1 glutamyl-tRNA reductase [Helicobacter saguini]
MYIIVSFSHQNTSVEVREKLHFSDEECIKILPLLRQINGIKEVMLLSTCNRCEIYAFVDSNICNNFSEKLQNLDSKNLMKTKVDISLPLNMTNKNTESTTKDSKKLENIESNLQDSRFYKNIDSIESKNSNICNNFNEKLQNLDSKSMQNSHSHPLHKSIPTQPPTFKINAKGASANFENTQKITEYLTKDSKKLENIESNHKNHQPFLNKNIESTPKDSIKKITDSIIKAISDYKKIDIKELENPQILSGEEAIKHVFCVASALVSLVVGESQISGQLKDAFKLSSENNFSSKWLNRLITYAFRCAAAVRSQTDISKNPVSIASIMATLALEFIESKALKSPKILIIGVGEMGKLSLKHLAKHNLNLSLTNRTQQNANALLDATKIDAKIIPFSDLATAINEHQIVITAVSGGVIITENMLKLRKNDRIFFDLSIPRNISFGSHSFGSTAIKSRDKRLKNILKNIEVVCVDDLKKRAAKHIESRRENLESALKIVDKFVRDFAIYLNNLELDPLIKKMRHKAKMASLKEINRAIKKGFLPEALRENITRLAHSIFNEFLHTPTMNLRAMSEEAGADSALESIAKFFGE